MTLAKTLLGHTGQNRVYTKQLPVRLRDVWQRDNLAEGSSPSLEWSGEPGDVRSFVLVVEDPDAPSGTFCHWLVYDISPDVHNLAQGLKPSSVGVSGTNDFGRPGYGGPCPPRGPAHRYYFCL